MDPLIAVSQSTPLPKKQLGLNQTVNHGRPRLGIVGFGSRVAGLLNTAAAHDLSFVISAVIDPEQDQILTRVPDRFRDPQGCRRFADLAEFLDSASEVDALIIATRCRLHAALAAQVAELRLPIFLEKPVGICTEDLMLLKQSYAGQEERVVVSFPLRTSPLFQAVREICKSGRLGKINQIQAVNYVPYGGVYFADWYRDESETGSLWLQKATHDLDYLGVLAGAAPKWIFATESQTIFRGKKPFDLRCSACDDAGVCPESPANLRLRGDHGGMGDGDHWCAFSEGIRHHDCASALIGYANGVALNYTQNFVARKPAGRRGARITGYLATLEFDWRTGAYSITEHHTSRVDHGDIKVDGGHNGGDVALWRNFLEVIAGKSTASPNLNDGLNSAELCLAAMRSCETGQMIPLG